MENDKLLDNCKLSTDPDLLLFHSYDSYDLKNDKLPIDSICRFTLSGLKHIFPLIKIELYNHDEISIENNQLIFSAIPNKDHIEYIKEIMINIFSLYYNDETKIPKSLYEWYFKK